jgi:3-deoxy-D-manno-octulosonic-acid transferase
VAAIVSAAGLTAGCRSQGDAIGEATDVYVADTIGEMGLWYRIADVAFLGGSLVPRGGQNPIEPAKLGAEILHGPHTGYFREVYDALAEASAVFEVSDGETLAAAIQRLLERPAERERLATNARICVERNGGAIERTLAALKQYLAPLGQGHEASARA